MGVQSTYTPATSGVALIALGGYSGTSQVGFTGSSYGAWAAGPSMSFTAPSSGVVFVKMSIPNITGASGNLCWITFALTGATTVAASDANAIIVPGVAATYALANSMKVTGLTPGGSYTLSMYGRTNQVGTSNTTPYGMTVEVHG